VELGVILVDTDLDGNELVDRARNKGHVRLTTEPPRWDGDLQNEQYRGDGAWTSEIRAFVIPENQFHRYSSTVGARFSRHGDVVEHCELQSLLWRLANRR
jgi:hypothetical protein